MFLLHLLILCPHLFDNPFPQITYCVLLSCFSDVKSQKNYCLVRHLEEQKDQTGCPILTEFDCPLLLLSTDVFVMCSDAVLSPVSIVHVCDPQCTFANSTTDKTIERELVHVQTLIFRHNLLNNMYCNNLFCISNNLY